MTEHLIHSPNLVNATHLLATSTPARIFASSPDSRRIVVVTAVPPRLNPVGESAVMDTEPGALVSFSSKVWTVCADGTLRSFSIASVPVQQNSYARGCSTNAWLLAYSSILIAPGPAGTVLTVNSSGTVLARAEGLMARIVMAVTDGAGVVYLFDGLGNGLVMGVNGTTGAITRGDFFEAPNCVDIRAAAWDSTNDEIVLVTHDRRVTFDTTVRAVPVLDDIRYYRTEKPTGLALFGDGSRYIAAEVPPDGFPSLWPQGPATVNLGLAVSLSSIGSMMYENPALDEEGDEVPFDTAPVNVSAPVASGTPGLGATMSCTTGEWTGWPVITYAYQWRRNGFAIAAATAATYVIVSADLSTFLDCVVTATDGFSVSASQVSNAISVSDVPVNTVAPVASGGPLIGATLSVTSGTWTGDPVISFTYQWRRAGVNIGGETANSYVLVSADFGVAVDCVITATNGFGSSTADSNDITGAKAPVNTVAPVASGTASVGSTLSCTTGTWTGTATITYTYQWRRDGSNISSATASTYLLVSADASTAVDCVVTGTNAYGNASQDSNNISVAAVNPSLTWTARTAASAINWESVAWGLAKYAAVSNVGGTTNAAMNSPDGVTWTSRNQPANLNFDAIAYSPSLHRFVALSKVTAQLQTSDDDGDTWTARTGSGVKGWTSVCWSPDHNQFVGVANADNGAGFQVQTSPDGITWTAQTHPENNTWNEVCYGIPTSGTVRYVAVASAGTNRVMTSPDGVTWTARAASAVSTWCSVACANGMFVAVSTGGLVMTSPDGVTWTSRTAAAASAWRRIRYGGGLFVAVAQAGTAADRAMASPDGITWTLNVAASTSTWLGIAYGTPSSVGTWVAVGSDAGTRVMTVVP